MNLSFGVALHGGPLTQETVDQPAPHPKVSWEQLRDRNVPLLEKLTEVYGSCAVLARDGNKIVGQLRFYPRILCKLASPGPGLCMQQTFPNGPADGFVENNFPSLDEIADKTLFVHCMMIVSSKQEDNSYQRKGLGLCMAKKLIEWARSKGWKTIEANAYSDLPLLYSITGQAGRMFWEKLGFDMIESEIESAFSDGTNTNFVDSLLKEAADRGIDDESAKTKYTMRLAFT